MKVEIKCPPIILRGCDNGAFQTPNANTQLAPNGAINNSVEVILVKYVKVRIVKIP